MPTAHAGAPDHEDDHEDHGDRALIAALRAALTRATIVPTLTAMPADQALSRLVETATVAIPAAAGSLLLVDQAANVLTFAVAVGQSAARVADLTVPLGRGIAGLVAVSGQPLAIANAQQDPRHARDIAEQAGYLPTTLLAVPVTSADGAVVGVLELLDRQGAASFSLADMELLGQFAGLCALALEQRRVETVQVELIGRALLAMGGAPLAADPALAARLQALAARVMADPAARRARELAGRVAAIAAGGEAEQRACEAILAIFTDYIAAHPEPGAGIDAFTPGAFTRDLS